METTGFDENIIVKFLQNTASEKEIHLLDAWMHMDAKNREIFESYQMIWSTSELINKDVNSTLSFKAGEEKTESDRSQKRIEESKTRSLRVIKTIFRYAAVVILSVGLSWLAFSYLENPQKTEISYNEIITPMGSRTHIILPDGSDVWLNADSYLKFPSVFSDNNREVELKGEGYFKVKKDSLRQFIVSTSDIKVKVLGTTFNVKSYPEEGTVETTLVEGKIELQRTRAGKKGKVISMKPEQRVMYIKDEGKVILSEIKKMNASIGRPVVVPGNIFIADSVRTEIYTAWKDGRLIIENEPLEELAVKLERKFDVKIEFENDRIRNYKFTGILENETLEQVLYAMELSSHIKYRIDKKTVYLESLN
jgi:ferric-dicitrate binding protein FerR (iron transport regulator)